MKSSDPLNPILDPANLAANRRGELTDAQRTWLRAANSRVNFLIYGFVLAIVLFMGISFAPTLETAPIEVWLSLSIMLVVGIVAVGIPGLKSLFDLQRLNRELASSHVEQADGRVLWQRHAYGAEIEGHRLKTQVGFALEPGDYVFFYLPQTRWLVGAERRALQTAETPELQNILSRILRCDSEALDANRRGELADSQRRYLTFVTVANYFAALVALGLVAILGLPILNNPSSENLGGLILLAVPLILTGFFVLRGFRLTRDLVNTTVSMAEGKATRSISGNTRSMTYYWHVGSERFTVSASAYMAFVEGPKYRVYYTPKAMRIVNIEIRK